MTHDSLEVLSAIFDGEIVDPGQAAAALASEGAAEFLLDLARLRVDVASDRPSPSASFYERTRSIGARAVAPVDWWRRRIAIPIPALAAAGIAGMILFAWLGLVSRADDGSTPPPVDRVIRLEPAQDWKEVVEGPV